jgi:hypothetical protein
MAEETTAGLGEALGLQTSATPYSGSPIFRGLQTGLQYEMKREALKAKEAAEEEKKRLAFEKSVTSPTYPRVGKRWQKSLESIGKETLYGMYDAASKGDREMQQEFRMKGQILGNSIAAQNDYENKIRNSKALLPKTVSQSLDSDDDTGITQTDYKWHDYIEPVDMGMIGGNQRYSFNLLEEVQPMDIRKENATVINDMLSDKPLTETGASLRNYFGAKKELNKEDLKKLSTILVGQNLQYRNNLLVKFEDEGKKILQNYINKGLQYDEAKERALEDLAFNKIKEVYEPKFTYKGVNVGDSLTGYRKRIFDEINTETLPVGDAVGMVTKIVMDKKGLTNKLGVEGGVETVLSPEIQRGAEYQMVVLPINTKRVKLKTTGGQMVDMVPETFVEINNYVGDDINGIYVLGSTSVLGGNDVDFNIKGFKFNKAVKVTNENIGSIATSKGMSVKDLAEFVNAKVGYDYITPQITQTKANKSTSTGGGKGKGKGNNIPSTNVSSR